MNYLIYGNSYNLIDKEIENILCGRKPDIYTLSEISLNDILEDVNYNSMFEEEKVIILKDFEFLCSSKKDSSKDLERLESYLSDPNENVTIIFTSSEKISSRGSTKGIVSNLEVIETPIITKPQELAKIFGEFIKQSGYKINKNALNIFCDKCVSNYDIAKNEFEKIIKIKGDDHLITEEDIIDYVSNYNLTDSFGFKDAVINKDLRKSIQILDDLESSKMEIIPLVVMLAKEYEAIYNIKLLASKKMTNDMISSEMGGMHPFRVKLLREAGAKYTTEKLEELIVYLCNLDLKLVSEDNLGYDELRKFFLII